MRHGFGILAGIVCLALSACTPTEADRADSSLSCAALISAAHHLMRTGEIDNDPVFAKRALWTSMTHLNAYAIPKKIPEAQAFEEVKSIRASLMADVRPNDIMTRAKRCADRLPR